MKLNVLGVVSVVLSMYECIKFRRYRKIVSLIVGLLYSIVMPSPMYSVSSAIFLRGKARTTYSPIHWGAQGSANQIHIILCRKVV